MAGLLTGKEISFGFGQSIDKRGSIQPGNDFTTSFITRIVLVKGNVVEWLISEGNGVTNVGGDVLVLSNSPVNFNVLRAGSTCSTSTTASSTSSATTSAGAASSSTSSTASATAPASSAAPCASSSAVWFCWIWLRVGNDTLTSLHRGMIRASVTLDGVVVTTGRNRDVRAEAKVVGGNIWSKRIKTFDLMGSFSSVLGVVGCPSILDFDVGSSKSDVVRSN